MMEAVLAPPPSMVQRTPQEFKPQAISISYLHAKLYQYIEITWHNYLLKSYSSLLIVLEELDERIFDALCGCRSSSSNSKAVSRIATGIDVCICKFMKRSHWEGLHSRTERTDLLLSPWWWCRQLRLPRGTAHWLYSLGIQLLPFERGRSLMFWCWPGPF